IAAATIGSWRASGALEIPSAFVVFTERGRTLMVEGGVPAERVHVIPHSTPDPGPRAAPPSESTDILYLGRLAAEKGILSLVERWDELGGGLRLVVAGDGPQRPAVESAARGQNVVLSGWV